ncbi:hypothetical protein THAOC_00635 [Thalassiosira oceanica]|uniref:Uncharacterized protein n=1 Tax=Thalassiosira oceanica TaxID=159749 RepID=K0TIS7_THAOC|nr:hypothetical protein THAOC_00635 [Thalassiosira oceanica]|eukprot:EJK77530.1 hypothetical protein THAOC_00635 [Thalassiosira oceanica]
MAGGKQPRGRSDPEGAVLASSKSVAPTVSAKSCHANNLKQRSGGRARTPARDKQDAGRGRGRSKSRTHTPARPAQGKSDGAAPISSITVKKGDEDEVSKIGDASAMATRPVSRPKNMNKPGPSRKRSKSREHTRGKSKERGLSKEEKHEQKKRDISQKLKSLELQSSNKKSLTHKNTEAKPLKRGRRPAYEGSRFDCDVWGCKLTGGTVQKKTTERTTSKEGDEQAYLESANNLRDEGQNARKSRGRMGGFSRPRAFSRGRGKIGAEEQGGNSIARKFSRARSKSRTRRKTETSIGESKDEGEQGSEKKSRMSRVRSMSRSRARADSTVSSGDNDNKTHSFSEAMAKGVKRLGSKGFGLLKKDNTVQSESDIPNKEIPTKEDAAILDSSMAANSVPSGAASAARRHSFDSGRFDEYTAALSDSGRDAYSELRKRSLDRSRGSRSLSPPPAAETRLVVRDDSTYMTFDGTIRSADSSGTTALIAIQDGAARSMIRREGVVRHTQGGAIQSLRHGTDRLCTEASRTIGHGVAARTIFVEARPQMTAEDNSDTIVDKAAVSDGTHSVHEVQVFHLRDQAIDGALDAIRSALGRPSPFGSDAGSFRSRRGRSYSRSPSPYERRSSYSESYQARKVHVGAIQVRGSHITGEAASDDPTRHPEGGAVPDVRIRLPRDGEIPFTIVTTAPPQGIRASADRRRR